MFEKIEPNEIDVKRGETLLWFPAPPKQLIDEQDEDEKAQNSKKQLDVDVRFILENAYLNLVGSNDVTKNHLSHLELHKADDITLPSHGYLGLKRGVTPQHRASAETVKQQLADYLGRGKISETQDPTPVIPFIADQIATLTPVGRNGNPSFLYALYRKVLTEYALAHARYIEGTKNRIEKQRTDIKMQEKKHAELKSDIQTKKQTHPLLNDPARLALEHDYVVLKYTFLTELKNKIDEMNQKLLNVTSHSKVNSDRLKNLKAILQHEFNAYNELREKLRTHPLMQTVKANKLLAPLFLLVDQFFQQLGRKRPRLFPQSYRGARNQSALATQGEHSHTPLENPHALMQKLTQKFEALTAPQKTTSSTSKQPPITYRRAAALSDYAERLAPTPQNTYFNPRANTSPKTLWNMLEAPQLHQHAPEPLKIFILGAPQGKDEKITWRANLTLEDNLKENLNRYLNRYSGRLMRFTNSHHKKVALKLQRALDDNTTTSADIIKCMHTHLNSGKIKPRGIFGKESYLHKLFSTAIAKIAIEMAQRSKKYNDENQRTLEQEQSATTETTRLETEKNDLEKLAELETKRPKITTLTKDITTAKQQYSKRVDGRTNSDSAVQQKNNDLNTLTIQIGPLMKQIRTRFTALKLVNAMVRILHLIPGTKTIQQKLKQLFQEQIDGEPAPGTPVNNAAYSSRINTLNRLLGETFKSTDKQPSKVKYESLLKRIETVEKEDNATSKPAQSQNLITF